jgi:ABC-type sugar transport system permease subunit
VFDAREFWTVIWATLFYTVFGTCGALIVGLFAAMLLNKSFRGQGVLRGLYLFPLRRAGHRGGVFLGDPVRPVLGLA